jgi:ABC-type multidrug transport system fused ATPase/permease subunit
VIWRGGFGVLANGMVTIGVLAMFIQYSQRFWRPIQDLSDKYNILQAAMAACERIFKLLDTRRKSSARAAGRRRRLQPHRVPPRLVHLSETDSQEQQAAVAAARHVSIRLQAGSRADFSADNANRIEGALAP